MEPGTWDQCVLLEFGFLRIALDAADKVFVFVLQQVKVFISNFRLENCVRSRIKNIIKTSD